MQMNDISYEILDLFKKYGADKEGILKILEADSRPEVLYALSDIRRNLMDWMDFSGQENVLQLGSDYGVITGLLAELCDHVAVVDERDENLVVNQKMNDAYTNVSYIKAAVSRKWKQLKKKENTIWWSYGQTVQRWILKLFSLRLLLIFQKKAD